MKLKDKNSKWKSAFLEIRPGSNRLGMPFDPMKDLDRRCLRDYKSGVFDLDVPSFDMGYWICKEIC